MCQLSSSRVSSCMCLAKSTPSRFTYQFGNSRGLGIAVSPYGQQDSTAKFVISSVTAESFNTAYHLQTLTVSTKPTEDAFFLVWRCWYPHFYHCSISLSITLTSMKPAAVAASSCKYADLINTASLSISRNRISTLHCAANRPAFIHFRSCRKLDLSKRPAPPNLSLCGKFHITNSGEAVAKWLQFHKGFPSPWSAPPNRW